MKPLFIRTTFLLLKWATWWWNGSISAQIFPQIFHNILKVMLLMMQENHCITQCIQQVHHSCSGQTFWVIFNKACFATKELFHLMIHFPLHNAALLCQKWSKNLPGIYPLWTFIPLTRCCTTTVQSKSRTNMFTSARVSLNIMATQWHAWTWLRNCTVSWITRTLHEICPYSFISLWTPMYTTCHTFPSLSNVMESLGFGSKDTFKILTDHPIVHVIIRVTHNTLDHWSLSHNVTVHLSFVTLYNYISAKKYNIYKQAICACLPASHLD
jgi:hypothetical protein